MSQNVPYEQLHLLDVRGVLWYPFDELMSPCLVVLQLGCLLKDFEGVFSVLDEVLVGEGVLD